jgi:DnaJ-class molecular chaperone
MDLYQRLGIKRGASEAEIKKAYRSLAKQLHPDRNKDNPNAAKRFGEVTAAYDLLSDKDKRARYDRGEIDEEGNPKMPFGSGGFGGGGGRRGGSFGGFRQRSQPLQKGADIAYRLTVDFVDAAMLKPQRITLADGKTIDLKLPKGVEDGTKIRLAGKGQQGPGGAGDGIVTIAIAGHPFYRREGNDIRMDLPVTLREAVLGSKVKVPTPDGPVMLTVPKGSSSGKVLRIKGRGFTDRSGKRGDQLLNLEVSLPASDAELESFAERWNNDGNPRASLGV